MRLNSAVVFTLILLALMVGAGFVSAATGYRLGREALKGITQPDTRPTSSMARQNKSASGQEQLLILREEDILADVKARMEGRVPPEETAEQSSPEQQSDADASAEENADGANAAPSVPGLPVSSSDRGVTLEVRSARRQGSTLVLDVTLENAGSQPVEFLYSFMNVRDDKGEALSASTEGLPSELPSGSEKFSGEVKIPVALLEESEKLSLTLSDYPDQQIQLNLSGIPVIR